jgi:hypothetical protein
MALYDFMKSVKNKTTKLFTRKPKSKSKSNKGVASQKKRVTLNPRGTQILETIQKSYKKKLKRQKDIANFTKKRASRKIIVAYRSALANPNLKECAICLGPMLNPSLTTTLYHCKHIFHTSCIKKWAANKYNIPRCPLCKTQILYYENPTIVKPKKTEQDFMDRLIKVRIWAKYEAEQIAKASAYIAKRQEQLINRTARDGSSVRMTRGHKQMLEDQISKSQTKINMHNSINYRAKLLELEQQLAANIVREREIATRTDAALLELEDDNDNYSDSDTDSAHHGGAPCGGARCANCAH